MPPDCQVMYKYSDQYLHFCFFLGVIFDHVSTSNYFSIFAFFFYIYQDLYEQELVNCGVSVWQHVLKKALLSMNGGRN